MSEEPKEPEDEVAVEPAPEGASCGEHPERGALVTCPRCGSYCCIACWQALARRCHACLLRDPGPPVPWADASRSLPVRFFATLGAAVAPRASAARFASGAWGPARSFFALTYLPLALLSGVIPFTHHLGFGPSWAVHLLHAPTGERIALDLAVDLAQALGLGLLVSTAKLAVLAAAYLSIAGAYGKKLASEPGRQVLLYRGWLLPLGGASGVLLGVVIWGFPLEPTEGMRVFAEIVSLVPIMLLLGAMISTARQAYGVGPFASLLVVLVPFVAMFVVEPLLYGALAPWLPDAEAMREALDAG